MPFLTPYVRGQAPSGPTSTLLSDVSDPLGSLDAIPRDLQAAELGRAQASQASTAVRTIASRPRAGRPGWASEGWEVALMRRLGVVVILLSLLAGVPVGCGRGQTPIPTGAQVVHVVVTASEVRLDPATAHAGDVYLMLDEPLDGSFAFVERKRTAAETPGPLSDDDLERLAHGDTEGTSIGSSSVGCDAAQQAEDRGQMGYCGNVWKFVLVEGKYAILGPGWTEQETEASVDPTGEPAGFLPPPSMAVLEVLP